MEIYKDYQWIYHSSNNYLIYNWIFILLLVYMLYKIYRLLTIKTLYSDITQQQLRTNDYNRLYKHDELPHFYPNTWLPVLESIDLKCNQIKSITAFGYDLVVYRGISGESHVFDAYCPHLGANLGVGGTIIGETIRCPFHGWVFNSEGKCSHVPGIECESLPKARVKVWNSVEFNGFIYVWHHSNGTEPDWYPTEHEEIKQNEFKLKGKSVHITNCHIQELFENAADNKHLIIHQPPTFLGPVLQVPKYLRPVLKIFSNTFQSNNWLQSEVHRYQAIFKVNAIFNFFGWPLATAKIIVKFYGPGISRSEYTINNYFGGLIIYLHQDIIQIGPMKQKLITNIYSKNNFISALISKLILHEVHFQLQRDVIIWNNKKLLRQPYFSKDEHTLVEYRRWSSQFYPSKKSEE